MASADSRHVLELPASTSAPRLGRQFVGRVLEGWHLGGLNDTATLLASEVVTNAVIHARSVSRLRIDRIDGGVRVTVEDFGEGLATKGTPRRGVLGGHGLALVDTLADQWGARRIDGHHEVWFELRAPTDA